MSDARTTEERPALFISHSRARGHGLRRNTKVFCIITSTHIWLNALVFGSNAIAACPYSPGEELALGMFSN